MQCLVGSTLNRKRNKILEPPCLLLAFQLPQAPVATHNELGGVPKAGAGSKANYNYSKPLQKGFGFTQNCLKGNSTPHPSSFTRLKRNISLIVWVFLGKKCISGSQSLKAKHK